jgi:hypothetical protein
MNVELVVGQEVFEHHAHGIASQPPRVGHGRSPLWRPQGRDTTPKPAPFSKILRNLYAPFTAPL